MQQVHIGIGICMIHSDHIDIDIGMVVSVEPYLLSNAIFKVFFIPNFLNKLDRKVKDVLDHLGADLESVDYFWC